MFLFFSQERVSECGEEIVSSSGMQLPSNEVCELKVKNKPGLSTALDIFWNAENVDREEICYGLEVRLDLHVEQKSKGYMVL